MARGTIIADNWLATHPLVTVDPASTAVASGAYTDLTDYESGVQIELSDVTAGWQEIDVVYDFHGTPANPNFLAVINHNLLINGSTDASIYITSADDAAQTVNAESLGLIDLRNIDPMISTPYNVGLALTEHTGGAKRYFRVHFKDIAKTTANEPIKIGQLVLGSDKMNYDATSPKSPPYSTYTAAGWSINYNAQYTQNLMVDPIVNETLGGEVHSTNLQDGRWRFENVFFESMNGTMLRQLLKDIGSQGIDRITRHNAATPLVPTVNLPIVFVPDIADPQCYYVDISQARMPIAVQKQPNSFSIGAFTFVEQGRGV